MIGAANSPHDRALRRTDFWAAFILLWGGFFVFEGRTLEMTRETGTAMYALSAFGFVVAVVLPILVRGVLKRVPPGEDEYLRKLLAISAATGFYFGFAVFVIWVPLSGSLVPDLTAPQLLGLMLVGAALGWFAVRWRDRSR